MQDPIQRGLLKGGRRVRPAQARTEKQDMPEYATRLACSHHLIEYYVPHGTSSRCPMCDLGKQYDDVRARVIALENELKIATNQVEKYKEQVEVQTAMRSALEILDDNDYEWLKVQMYQYKMDKSVTLKPTHGKLATGKRIKRGAKLPVNGFMTVPRRGDPEAHLATSIGGIAMAEYLDEALTCFGSAQAMGIMLKAWWKALPGGQT